MKQYVIRSQGKYISQTQTFMTADTQGATHKTAMPYFGGDKGTMVSQHYQQSPSQNLPHKPFKIYAHIQHAAL
jgi:hypothetical protein